MNIDEIYILEDRGFIFINGEDTRDFLQNIIFLFEDRLSEITAFAPLLIASFM